MGHPFKFLSKRHHNAEHLAKKQLVPFLNASYGVAGSRTPKHLHDEQTLKTGSYGGGQIKCKTYISVDQKVISCRYHQTRMIRSHFVHIYHFLTMRLIKLF